VLKGLYRVAAEPLVDARDVEEVFARQVADVLFLLKLNLPTATSRISHFLLVPFESIHQIVPGKWGKCLHCWRWRRRSACPPRLRRASAVALDPTVLVSCT
jgi:hypothetical protein